MQHHLAQVNIGRMRGPQDSPVMAEFVRALDEINALAEHSPGFVWRFQTDAGNAMAMRAYDDPLVIFNMSVWASVETLKAYVYTTMHGKFFARRQQWFDRMEDHQVALWWIPAGTRPTVDDAKARLEHLRTHGETPYAFTFRKPFPADTAMRASVV